MLATYKLGTARALQSARSYLGSQRQTAAFMPHRALHKAQATAQTGDFVVVDYTGKLSDGTVIESSLTPGQDPMQFVVGQRRSLKGLDRAVLGMEEGSSSTIVLEAREAFGEVDPSLVETVALPRGLSVKLGEKVTVSGSPALVTAVDDKTVTVDMNHELAGQAVTFDLALKSVVPAARLQRATFGAGCFWGVELAFQRVPGVLATEVGYTNGNTGKPTYEAVCSGSTGYAEVVQMVYDSDQVTYSTLLEVFFQRHDPTTLNRQGGDVGTQYRSGIYYHTPEQKEAAEKGLKEAQAKFRNSIVTEVVEVDKYYPAEEYHQQYLAKGGRFGRGQSTAKGCTDPIRCYG